MNVFYIIFCMVLNLWLHTKVLYEGLDNVFAFHNFQNFNSFPQVIFSSIQKFVLISFQCKFYITSNFAKSQ
jgi:hypothetical protein